MSWTSLFLGVLLPPSGSPRKRAFSRTKTWRPRVFRLSRLRSPPQAHADFEFYAQIKFIKDELLTLQAISFSKGVVDLYQGRIGEFTDNGVRFSADTTDSDTKWGPVGSCSHRRTLRLVDWGNSDVKNARFTVAFAGPRNRVRELFVAPTDLFRGCTVFRRELALQGAASAAFCWGICNSRIPLLCTQTTQAQFSKELALARFGSSRQGAESLCVYNYTYIYFILILLF
jgi:hypothetical protein